MLEMVHKDEMCAIFKTLRSVDRIEILCGMFQLCVPQELRFIASCLEDLIQKNYMLLYDAECVANDSKQLKEIVKPSNKIDKEFCASLNTYISLLHSDNTSCAISMYSILNDVKIFFENQLAENVTSNLTLNNEFIEDIKLIFTMASYHPAFTITQRLKMYEVCKSLKEKYNDPCHNERPNSLSGDDSSVEETQYWPTSVDVKYLNANQNEGDEWIVLKVSWSDGTITSCSKSKDEIQKFHLQLQHSFPNFQELQDLDNLLSIDSSSSSSSSESSSSSLVRSLKKYFQNLITISKDALKCQLLTNFLLSSGINTMFPVNSEQTNDNNNNNNNNNNSSSGDSELKQQNTKVLHPPIMSSPSNSNDSDELPSHSTYSQSSPSHSSKTIIIGQSFSSSNSILHTGSRNSKWNHSELRTKSVISSTNERLSQHGLHHHHHHHHRCGGEKSQPLLDTREPVITDAHQKGVEAMKDCEEISSQVFVTRISTTTPGCVVHGGGDRTVGCNSACSRQHHSDAQSFNASKNKQCKSTSNNQNPVNQSHFASHDVESNASVGLTVSGGRVLRPILGQNYKMAADDTKLPGLDPKISNSLSILPTLPRASSCGMILQHEQDLPSLVSADEGQMHPNFSTFQLPSNNFAFYNNLNSRINFFHLPPYPPFNHHGDSAHSQALPFPNIPLSALPPPPPHIDPSLLTPFTNSLPLSPPCTCCSSASLPPFANYPLWPPHIFFRGNGLVGPRFPHSNVRQCPSGVYIQTPFDYISYNSGAVISSQSSVTASSVPSTIVPASPAPPSQQLHASVKNFCQNCGSSTHSVDACSEPYMLSVTQTAQFKLKTIPKTDSINS